ncbi:MAG: hypothetical protein JSR62_12190 [Nitrospira sp.]|nr:hypothetical protein [Nitrospira sp.]
MLSPKQILRTLIGFILAVSFSWGNCVPEPAAAQESPDKRSFLVFDGTLFAEKPDLSLYGLKPLSIAYAGALGTDWTQYPDRLPDRSQVEKVARAAAEKSGRVAIDIEHWALKGNPQEVRRNIQKYITVLNWFREVAPDLGIGFYGVPPLRDYWRAIKRPGAEERNAWLRENDELRPLSESVDILFPSLYTFYNDREGWVRYAKAQIEEARRYGNNKLIYVFLWPQFHDSNHLLKGVYLPQDFWELELETARQLADGVVIWGGWGTNNKPMKWDEHATWWLATKDFMRAVSAPHQPSKNSVK